MMYATLGASRVTATPGTKGATCPGCGGALIAKCGTINVWHWAHSAGSDCDSWSEPMTAWHLEWQASAPPERREVVIGNHRADMVTARGLVVEVQHSHISETEIREREDHYGAMVWIFDAITAATEHYPTKGYGPRLDIRRPKGDHPEPTYRTFRWRQARRSITACRQPVYLDLGAGELLLLGRLHPEAPCGGWGHVWTREQVVACINASEPEAVSA